MPSSHRNLPYSSRSEGLSNSIFVLNILFFIDLCSLHCHGPNLSNFEQPFINKSENCTHVPRKGPIWQVELWRGWELVWRLKVTRKDRGPIANWGPNFESPPWTGRQAIVLFYCMIKWWLILPYIRMISSPRVHWPFSKVQLVWEPLLLCYGPVTRFCKSAQKKRSGAKKEIQDSICLIFDTRKQEAIWEKAPMKEKHYICLVCGVWCFDFWHTNISYPSKLKLFSWCR